MNASRLDARPVQPLAIRSLHWLTLAVLLAVYALVLAHEATETKAARQWTLDMHRTLGVSIWLLAWVRLAVRSRQPMRDVQPQTARAQRLVAGAGHGVMYLMLVGLPMLGWALTNARGQPVHLPLIGALPAWPGRDLDLADTLEAWHSTAAWVFAAIVGLHATAALWHHRFKRDDVLVAMLPGLIHHGRSGSRIDSPDHQPGFPTGNPSRSFS